eukprot:CAMPEP_0179907024 /NCGR_PEP_ID=MMETSP0982-20121206/43608_1 /TAXON_ID=483367 /ORGANISM="non described non described, Strain CCMP 2436" /LENGTH=112 /DNA_ID=CAMNT_0021807673 /DNA_START=196 /DNA_END=535 /DNA_ORIENTATION=+
MRPRAVPVVLQRELEDLEDDARRHERELKGTAARREVAPRDDEDGNEDDVRRLGCPPTSIGQLPRVCQVGDQVCEEELRLAEEVGAERARRVKDLDVLLDGVQARAGLECAE